MFADCVNIALFSLMGPVVTWHPHLMLPFSLLLYYTSPSSQYFLLFKPLPLHSKALLSFLPIGPSLPHLYEMATKSAEEALELLKYQVKNALIIDRSTSTYYSSHFFHHYGLFLLHFLNPFLNCFCRHGS